MPPPLADATLRPRVRRLASAALPRLRSAEWQPLPLLVDIERLRKAFHVLKMNDMHFLHVRHVLVNGSVPVIHLVRHPGGQFESGWRRYFGALSEWEHAHELEMLIEGLRAAVLAEPRWSTIVGNIDSLSLPEAVLWFWRINNEEIFRAGRQSMSSYLMIRYEDMVFSPLESARVVFRHFGLPWDKGVEQRIRAALGDTVWGPLRTSSAERLAHGWRDTLDRRMTVMVDQVMNGDPVASWW